PTVSGRLVVVHPQIVFTCSQMWTIPSATFDCLLLHTTRRMPMTDACMEETTMLRTPIGTLILVLGILVMPLVSHAQQPKKIYRVGYLTLERGIDQRFRETLAQLGYVEGHNLVLEGRFAQGHRAHLPALAAELVQLGVEVIVTVTTPAA